MSETNQNSGEFLTDFSSGTKPGQAPRPKTKFTPDEVEEVRQRAYLEGLESVEAQAAQDQAHMVADIGAQIQSLVNGLNETAFAHKQAAFDLALAVAEKVSLQALDRFPSDAIQSVFTQAMEHVPTTALLTVSVPENVCEPITALFNDQLESELLDRLTITAVPEQSVLCVLGWKTEAGDEGETLFDPHGLLEDIETIVKDRLSAEEPIDGQMDLFAEAPTALDNS